MIFYVGRSSIPGQLSVKWRFEISNAVITQSDKTLHLGY